MEPHIEVRSRQGFSSLPYLLTVKKIIKGHRNLETVGLPCSPQEVGTLVNRKSSTHCFNKV